MKYIGEKGKVDKVYVFITFCCKESYERAFFAVIKYFANFADMSLLHNCFAR